MDSAGSCNCFLELLHYTDWHYEILIDDEFFSTKRNWTLHAIVAFRRSSHAQYYPFAIVRIGGCYGLCRWTAFYTAHEPFITHAIPILDRVALFRYARYLLIPLHCNSLIDRQLEYLVFICARTTI